MGFDRVGYLREENVRLRAEIVKLREAIQPLIGGCVAMLKTLDPKSEAEWKAFLCFNDEIQKARKVE